MSLAIRHDEKVCIVGRSGSGKTTLLDVIGTLLRLSSGQYFLDGRRISALDETALARLRGRYFGFVFQSFHLLDHCNVMENVLLGGRYRGADQGYEKRALRALDALGIAQLRGRLPQQISGGEKQRVAIARALAGNPRIVLADEPTGNLDSETGAAVLDALFEACGEGRGLILVTHDRSMARRFPRVIEMRDGRIVDA